MKQGKCLLNKDNVSSLCGNYMNRRAKIMKKFRMEEEDRRRIAHLPPICTKPYTGKKIKTFIISFNRSTFLKQQIESLSKNAALDLHIIDNGSTYPPLLEYLSGLTLNVTFLEKNEGHTVIWKNNISKQFCPNEPYIVTDNDVIPDNENFHELLIQGLEEHPEINKVGLGLHIDDLPETSNFKDEIIRHEKGFKATYTSDYKFAKLPVDTTMAIYRSGYHEYSVWGIGTDQHTGECKSLRTIHPNWQAKHLSWYLTPCELQSEENIYYFNSLKKLSTHWSEKQAEVVSNMSVKLDLSCFDAIYCINLKEREDRLKLVYEEFESMGISDKVTRFEAIKNEIGWKGVLDSHIEIIRNAKQNNLKNVLVFEDDVMFLEKDRIYLNNLFNSIKNLPEFNLLYLSCNVLKPLIRENEFLFLAKECLTTHAICYNSSVYDKILKDYDTYKYNLGMIDVYLMNKIQINKKSYVAGKCCVTQRDDYSSVENKNTNYNFIVKNFSRNVA